MEEARSTSERKNTTDAVLASSGHFVGLPHGGTAERHTEGPRYNFRYSRHTLDIFLDSPTPDEVRIFRTAPCRMGIWQDEPVLWVIFRLDGMEWADAPYTPYLVEPEGRTFPTLEDENSRCPLVMTMNDALDGTVRAIRLITMSPEMTRRVHQAARSMLEQPGDLERYHARVAETYQQYPSTADMVGNADMVEQLGS